MPRLFLIMVDDEIEVAVRQRLTQEGIAVFEGPRAEELVPEIRRRAQAEAPVHPTPEPENLLTFADLTLNKPQHRVTRGDRPVHLSPTDFRLLELFLGKPRRMFSRVELVRALWGAENEVEARTIDVQVNRLRRALSNPGAPDLIRTVRTGGGGYALDDR